jgi:predicted nucleotidyltransferase
MAVARDQEIVEGLLNRYLQCLKDSNMPIWRVYFFGSFATGNPHEHSDIDVAVFLNQDDINGFKENVELALLGSQIDTRIEPHAFARPDFDDPDPFIDTIIRTGKRIL